MIISLTSIAKSIPLWIAAGCLAAILLLGFFMPLYADEILWDLTNHRAIVDGFHLIDFYPQCHATEDFSTPLPWLLYPYAVVNLFLFMADSLVWIRVLGMIRLVLFLVSVWFIIKTVARDRASAISLFLLFCALLSLDLEPLLMQMTRPEQTLLLGASLFMGLALYGPTLATRPAAARGGAGALFLLTAFLMFPSHGKAIALLPIALVSCWELFRRIAPHKGWVWAAEFVVLAVAVQSEIVWLQRLACPYSAYMHHFIEQRSLPLRLLASSPGLFFKAVLDNIQVALWLDFFPYANLPGCGFWLPQSLTPIPTALSRGIFGFYVAGWILRLMMLTFAMVMMLKYTVSLMKQWLCATPRQHGLNTPATLGFAATLSLVIILCIGGQKRGFYNSALEIPLLLLATLMWQYGLAGGSAGLLRQRRICNILGIAAIANVMLLFYCYYPYITDPGTRDVIANGVVAMMSPFTYGEQEKAVTETYNSCGLPPIEKAAHLITDNSTYPVVRKSYEPFPFEYVTGIVASKSFNLSDLLAQARRFGSDGIIMRCETMPPDLRAHFASHNGYCCASITVLEHYNSQH